MGRSTLASADVAHLEGTDADVAAPGDVALRARPAGLRRRAVGASARARFGQPRRATLRLVPPLPDVSEPVDDAPATVDDRGVPIGEAPTTSGGWPSATGWADDSRSAGVRRSPVCAPANVVAMAAGGQPVPARWVGARGRVDHAPVRLTRRGRVVVIGLLLVLVATLVAVLASRVQAAGPPGQPHAVVVHQGDTLWSIAARVHPRGSLIETMLAIERLNHMSDGTVFVGQRLLIPTS